MQIPLRFSVLFLVLLMVGCSVGHRHRHNGKRYRMTSDNIEYHKKSMAEIGDVQAVLRNYPKPERTTQSARRRLSKAVVAEGDNFQEPEIFSKDLQPLMDLCNKLKAHAKGSPSRSGFTSAGRLLNNDAKKVCGRHQEYTATIVKLKSTIEEARRNEVIRQENAVKREAKRAAKRAEAERKEKERLAELERKLNSRMNADNCAKPGHARSCDGVFKYLKRFPEGPNADRARAAQKKGSAKLKRLRKAERDKKARARAAKSKRAGAELRCFKQERANMRCAYKSGTHRTNCRCGAVIRCCRKFGRPRSRDCFSCD